MNNSIICLIGRKNVIVSKKEAEQVKKILEDQYVEADYLISLQKISFRKGSVRSVEVLPDAPNYQSSSDSQMRDFYDEEKKMVEKESAYSADVKSKHLDFFEMIWWCSCGEKEVPEDIKQKTIKIQYDFFTKNPKRRFCDLHLLRPIIKMRQGKFNQYALNGLILADKVVFRDMQLAGHFKNMPKFVEKTKDQIADEITINDIPL